MDDLEEEQEKKMIMSSITSILSIQPLERQRALSSVLSFLCIQPIDFVWDVDLKLSEIGLEQKRNRINGKRNLNHSPVSFNFGFPSTPQSPPKKAKVDQNTSSDEAPTTPQKEDEKKKQAEKKGFDEFSTTPLRLDDDSEDDSEPKRNEQTTKKTEEEKKSEEAKKEEEERLQNRAERQLKMKALRDQKNANQN